MQKVINDARDDAQLTSHGGGKVKFTCCEKKHLFVDARVDQVPQMCYASLFK